jgi:hypothetical protein
VAVSASILNPMNLRPSRKAAIPSYRCFPDVDRPAPPAPQAHQAHSGPGLDSSVGEPYGRQRGIVHRALRLRVPSFAVPARPVPRLGARLAPS